jgi:hypothetical protein
MTFKGQSNAEMLCWRQAVEHENRAKRNFETITDSYTQSKFYQGKA